MAKTRPADDHRAAPPRPGKKDKKNKQAKKNREAKGVEPDGKALRRRGADGEAKGPAVARPAGRPAAVPVRSGRRIQVRRSGVHGKGVFALQPIAAGDTIIE